VRDTIQCIIYKGEEYYVAECLDFPVVTQGKTLDEAVANLEEAIALHLEGENLNELGFVSSPRLEIRIEAEKIPDVS